MSAFFSEFPDLRLEEPAPRIVHVILDDHAFRRVGAQFDAPNAYERYGFGGPDVAERLAAHREKAGARARRPDQ